MGTAHIPIFCALYCEYKTIMIVQIRCNTQYYMCTGDVPWTSKNQDKPHRPSQ